MICFLTISLVFICFMQPGTGKTTVAQRFGIMFKNLELLPRADVEVVTAANLISRYMGNTGPNVVEAMRRAKGGVLFIDGEGAST